MTTQSTPKRIFVTGGTGYVGKSVIELAIRQGHKVHALSRSESGDAKLLALGATPARGDLTSLDVLRSEAAAADAVIHLATAYEFGRGSYDDALPVDMAATEALAAPLRGTGKPLVFTSGTLLATPDPSGGEVDETAPYNLEGPSTRYKAEEHCLSLAKKHPAVRAISVRLAPFVYGRGGSGVALFMKMSVPAGGVTCVDGGAKLTTVVHVDDAASLYLLAAEKAKAGDVFNASSGEEVSFRQVLGAIADAVGLPLRDMTFDEVRAAVGDMVAWFLRAENRASGGRARRELGWKPVGVGILEDISNGSYQEVAKALKAQAV